MTAPAEPAPDVPPLVEPTAHDWWDEDPRTAARYDRAWFDRDED